MASESVFILLGSNLGNRERLVNQACRMMGERCGEIVAKSRLYESEPWGFKSEHWFLNQVVQINTLLSPNELMQTLLDIEKELDVTVLRLTMVMCRARWIWIFFILVMKSLILNWLMRRIRGFTSAVLRFCRYVI